MLLLGFVSLSGIHLMVDGVPVIHVVTIRAFLLDEET